MQAAVIVHARTLHSDFIPGFLARPNNIDVEWARSKVLAATSNIDLMNGERWLIVDNEDYRILGIVTFLQYLVKNAHAQEAERFCYDEKGRRIFVFVGFVIKKDGRQRNPYDINYEKLWQAFKRYAEPVWEHTVVETTISNYDEVLKCKDLPAAPCASQEYGSVKYHRVGSDKAIFDWQQCQMGVANFCTNLQDIKILRKKTFTVVTTSDNLIGRMRDEADRVDTQKGNQSERKKNPSNIILEPSKTHVNTYMIVLLIVLVLLVLAIIGLRPTG